MKEHTEQWERQLKTELIHLSTEIYKHPELGNEEVLASGLHMDLLKKYGFDVTAGYLEIPTAFRAEYRSGKPGPVIAYMAEYDALPGIGHGCGHNILGAVSSGAGILLSCLVDEIGGAVVVFGTPAEETNGAKVIMAERGAFHDIAIAMMAHPYSGHVKSGSSLAMVALQFEFRGKTSHAASAPEKGINALDGVINTFNNINALRQQVKSDARIHGIVKEGGKAANIIPDYCVAQFYVRAATKTYLLELTERVKNCARGAALASGTELTISNYELSYDNLVTNQKLSSVYTEILAGYGAVIEEPRPENGSLDAGNVSHICPAIHPYFDITERVPVNPHSTDFADCTLTDYAYDQMMITAKSLALTGANIIRDQDLFDAIQFEFEHAVK